MGRQQREEGERTFRELKRLADAAADMLAALKALCEADRDDLNDSTSAVWQEAVIAIRKAEGREADHG